MGEELLARVLREIRERKRAAEAAHEESRQLERALAALGPRITGSVGPAAGRAARDRVGETAAST